MWKEGKEVSRRRKMAIGGYRPAGLAIINIGSIDISKPNLTVPGDPPSRPFAKELQKERSWERQTSGERK